LLDFAFMEGFVMKEVVELMLEAMKYHTAQTRPIHQTNEAIAIGEAVLAQPAQEPEIDLRTRWPMKNWKENKATPQQRPWVGLTDEDQFNLVHAMNENDWDAVQMMDAIEAKLKEKNT